MIIGRKIRVLVVDDSALFREILSKGISSDPNIEVVGVARDPFDAKEKISRLDIDVMTCDVEMPKMNGIDFVRELMPQHPIPVVVVSSVSNIVFDALNAGAVDFVAKPNSSVPNSMDIFLKEMITKIKIASTAKVLQRKPELKTTVVSTRQTSTVQNRIVAIGASTGGTEAILSVLKGFSPDIPGIVIVQHMPPVFTKMFAERLNNSTQLTVKEAETGDVVKTGTVLIAPGEYHMKVKRKDSQYVVECFKGEKVNGHCPAVDVLFDSVAEQAGDNAVGVILTGMGGDGAKGLLNMRNKGARTVGQDEKSCVVYGMPRVAFINGAVEKQASLENIAKTVYSLL